MWPIKSIFAKESKMLRQEVWVRSQCRKTSEIDISNYKRGKTLKYTQVQRQKAENNTKKLTFIFFGL